MSPEFVWALRVMHLLMAVMWAVHAVIALRRPSVWSTPRSEKWPAYVTHLRWGVVCLALAAAFLALFALSFVP